MKHLISILRIWLSSMYLYSAVMKFLNYSSSAQMIEGYKVLPPQLSRKLGFALPWTELLSGIALLSSRWLRLGSAISSLLGGSFFYASYNVLKRNDQVPCGCSGANSSLVDQSTLRRGLVITFSSLLLFFTSQQEEEVLPRFLVLLSIALPILPPLNVLVHRYQQKYQEALQAQRKKEKIEELTTLLGAQPPIAS